MRTHGTLVKWNDERGFGFVVVAAGTEEVFAHVSAFPRDGQRPQVGELVSFEIQAGPDGKRKAVNIQRPGARASRRTRPAEGKFGWRDALGALAGIVVLLAVAAQVYSRFAPPETVTQQSLPTAPLAQPLAAGESFTCDGRTHCSQMRSCAEAQYFLAHCPGTQMDGDNDREPCEEQWCR